MRPPRAPHQAHAQRPETLLREQPVGLTAGERVVVGRVPAIRHVPQPLAAAATDDRDLAAQLQDLEHAADAAGAVPAVPLTALGRPVLDVA